MRGRARAASEQAIPAAATSEEAISVWTAARGTAMAAAMGILRLLTAALLTLTFSAAADEAIGKLMTGHEQALRSARLPIHRKLLVELQKLELLHQKSGDKIALTEVQAEIGKVKQWIADASQPVAGGAGPQPADFKLIAYTAEGGVFSSWENGEIKIGSRGFSWTNRGSIADLTNTIVLTGAFEAEIAYRGNVYSCGLTEADYTKGVQLFFITPQDNDRHTIKLKRTNGGALTAEFDGKPAALGTGAGARPDMHLRICLRLLKDAAVEVQNFTIKDLSGGRK